MNEYEAIIRLKSGDIRGLEILVRRYQLEAVHVAFPIVNDLGLAEEVVQDAFIKVFQNFSSFDETKPFRPWFLRIVVNGALKELGHQKRFVSFDPDQDECEDDGLYGEENPLLAFEQIEFSDRQIYSDLMKELLNSLSPEHRVVLILKYYRAMSEEEIADVVDIPLGTVKSRLHAAKKKLRCLLYCNDMVEGTGS